jgi:hypothetical protein
MLSPPYTQPSHIVYRLAEKWAIIKLMWFYLMPYTEPPVNFREDNSVILGDINLRLFDRERRILCITVSWTSLNSP